MHGELVTTRTPDLARLHGALIRSQCAKSATLDAALLWHGLAGNFYSSRLMNGVARKLLELGMDVLLANTRGHDGVNWTSIGGQTRAIGAALETVADCRADLAGWFDFLSERGYRRLAVVGHSLGAIKAMYAQAHQPQPSVACIVALSASRLNHEMFLRSPLAETFRQTFREAEQKVREGLGRSLMRVEFPFPSFVAADVYVDKYGPESRYDWTRFLPQVGLPTLLLFGARELQSNVAFLGLLDEVERLEAENPRVSHQVIPDADHFYTGRRMIAAQAVRDWLAATFPEAGRS